MNSVVMLHQPSTTVMGEPSAPATELRVLANHIVGYKANPNGGSTIMVTTIGNLHITETLADLDNIFQSRLYALMVSTTSATIEMDPDSEPF